MPGIAGMISQAPAAQCQQSVAAMLKSMMHERFYAAATYSAPELGVYGASIGFKEASKGGQILRNEDESIVLLFSGECFPEMASETDLRKNGHLLGGGRGDWLVHLYEEEGERLFEKLNGLFSGVLIDKRKKRVLLFNDRYGLERIYVHESDGMVYFTSEAKALLAALPELRVFDDEGVSQYLAFGCTMGERTLFRGINLLPGASCWRFGPDGLESKSRYFSPSQWEAQEPLTEQHYEAEFGETFQRVLPRYTEHAESVGISLTGGLDTRMVMACLPKSATPHPCYTFVGKSGLTLDARIAADVAAVRGLKHHPLRIHDDFLRDFGTHLDRTVSITDGCAGATASHEIYFNGKARQLSPVRLTGNFGSEVFRSISTFKPLRLAPSLFSDSQARAVAATLQEDPGHGVHPVTFAAFREIPWNLFGLLAAGRSQVTFRTPYLDNELVALAYRAPAAQRLSPVPALRFIESACPALARIPTDRGELLGTSKVRHALSRALGEATFKLDYLHKEGLPGGLGMLDPLLNLFAPCGILGLHKFLPYRRWFQQELAPTIMERIATDRVRTAPWWASGVPEALARAHFSGRGNYVRELNAILSLEAIDRLFLSVQARQDNPPIRRDVPSEGLPGGGTECLIP
jgi:asparagine synthase (glutamine-hydrolysing)